MEYKELATLYHMDSSPDRESHLKQVLLNRKNDDSTFNIDISLPSGNLFLAVPRELSILNQKVLRRERAISNLMKSLPGIAGNEVMRSLVMDEVVMSNIIENIHSTRAQIEEALSSRGSGDLKSKRFREFAKLYMDLVLGDYVMPKSSEDIRAIYDRIMDGEDLKYPPDGDVFRKDAITVVDGMNEIHHGINPESAIVKAMDSMIKLVNSSEIPELYSALISHFIFEYVHPFYDGNGRTGRYLLAMFLEEPLSKPTALSLSRVMAENRSLYYHAFQTVENPLNHGEVTFFVMAMHELILKAQDELLDRLENNIKTLNKIRDIISNLSKSADFQSKELDIIFALLQQKSFGVNPSKSLSDLAGYIHLGTQQTRKYLSALEKEEIIEKTRGRDPLTFALTDRFLTKCGLSALREN